MGKGDSNKGHPKFVNNTGIAATADGHADELCKKPFRHCR